MNFQEFLKRLKVTTDLMSINWFLQSSGSLVGHSSDGNHCPITAVCMEYKGKSFPYQDPGRAAGSLGMSAEVCSIIVRSSDYPYPSYSRSSLLKVCGIES